VKQLHDQFVLILEVSPTTQLCLCFIEVGMKLATNLEEMQVLEPHRDQLGHPFLEFLLLGAKVFNLKEVLVNGISVEGREKLWTDFITPQWCSELKHVVPTSPGCLYLLKSKLHQFESSLSADATWEWWPRMDWLKRLQAAQSFGELAQALLELETSLLITARTPDFADHRHVWIAGVKCWALNNHALEECGIHRLSELLMKLEAKISWDSVKLVWNSKRDIWLLELGSNSDVWTLGEAMLQFARVMKPQSMSQVWQTLVPHWEKEVTEACDVNAMATLLLAFVNQIDDLSNEFRRSWIQKVEKLRN